MRHFNRANTRYPGLWRNCVFAAAPLLGPTGSTLRDWSGRGNHGTLTNMDPAARWLVSGGQYGLEFDGTNDYVPFTLDLSDTSKAMISVWMYWYTFANNDKLFMEHSVNQNTNIGFIINPNSSASTRFDVTNSSGLLTYNGGHFARPSAAAWHHYAFVFNRFLSGASGTRVWVDGIEQTLTITHTTAFNNNFASKTLYLASRAGTSLFGNFILDDLRVYRAAETSLIPLLSRRRGIAYETTRDRHYKSAAGFKPHWASQRTQIISGGTR